MIDRRKKEMLRMCGNKKAFFNTHTAARAATMILQKGGPLMRWYECPFCGKWHLTSQREKLDQDSLSPGRGKSYGKKN